MALIDDVVAGETGPYLVGIGGRAFKFSWATKIEGKSGWLMLHEASDSAEWVHYPDLEIREDAISWVTKSPE